MNQIRLTILKVFGCSVLMAALLFVCKSNFVYAEDISAIDSPYFLRVYSDHWETVTPSSVSGLSSDPSCADILDLFGIYYSPDLVSSFSLFTQPFSQLSCSLVLTIDRVYNTFLLYYNPYVSNPPFDSTGLFTFTYDSNSYSYYRFRAPLFCSTPNDYFVVLFPLLYDFVNYGFVPSNTSSFTFSGILSNGRKLLNSSNSFLDSLTIPDFVSYSRSFLYDSANSTFYFSSTGSFGESFQFSPTEEVLFFTNLDFLFLNSGDTDLYIPVSYQGDYFYPDFSYFPLTLFHDTVNNSSSYVGTSSNSFSYSHLDSAALTPTPSPEASPTSGASASPSPVPSQTIPTATPIPGNTFSSTYRQSKVYLGSDGSPKLQDGGYYTTFLWDASSYPTSNKLFYAIDKTTNQNLSPVIVYDFSTGTLSEYHAFSAFGRQGKKLLISIPWGYDCDFDTYSSSPTLTPSPSGDITVNVDPSFEDQLSDKDNFPMDLSPDSGLDDILSGFNDDISTSPAFLYVSLIFTKTFNFLNSIGFPGWIPIMLSICLISFILGHGHKD